MTSESVRYAATMLLAGVGIPVLAALNARLGARIGSPNLAAAVLFSVALLASIIVALLVGGFEHLSQLPSQPAFLFLGGLLVAFYVLAVTWVAPRFGLGNAVFFVLLGQLISATAIDHWGVFGAIVHPISAWRLVGLALMAAGLACVQLAQ